MPEELEALKKALNDALGELRVVRTERDLLKEQLNRFKRQLFDAKSEVSAAHQKDLFFNEAEVEGAQAQPAAAETEDEKIEVPAHKRTKRGRKPLDPALPRDVRRHELPEDERVCPHDGAALREIGVEVSEQMDVVPQQVRVIRHERVKYACPCCDGGLRLAAKPPQVIPKGLLSEAALAWVITSKYLDGLRPQRQQALLLALATQANLPRSDQLQVVPPHASNFADTGTAVVEEQQQRVVAPAVARAPVWHAEDQPGVLRFEIGSRPLPRLLCRDGQHTHVLQRVRQVIAQQVLEEAADRCPAAVARGWRVRPFELDVIEEARHRVGVEIAQLQGGDASAALVGDELEQQRQCVSVSADGVNAGASLPWQVLGEVRFDLREQTARGCAAHGERRRP
jgi:transposase